MEPIGAQVTSGSAEATRRAIGAFVAAAVGDALGWPQELQARRVGPGRNIANGKSGLRQWARRSGGRFYSHQEVIRAGEYSDDTQLLLCTSRSLLRGETWFEHFSRTELPVWLLYERGGGGATKRASRAWLLNKRPWADDTSDSDREAYFSAGGNGVAMRIMPHSLVGAAVDDFRPIARDVLANGMCTHGHPRALIGALAYAYALWVAFREAGTLEYGHLVNTTADAFGIWSQFPGEDLPADWLRGLKKPTERFGIIWREAAEEMNALLVLCRQAMQQGALSVDTHLLESLGCFRKDIGGAGTIAAAAAMFLASRYAADPMHGVLQAAFAVGADTDTLASMTGALLGAALGDTWIQEYARDVQDGQYLAAVAEKLTSREIVRDELKSLISPTVRARFIAEVREWRRERGLKLPDGRAIEDVERVSPMSAARGVRVDAWRVRTVDGQTIYVKQFNKQAQEVAMRPVEDRSSAERIGATKARVKLFVKSLERARSFYSEVIGLPIVGQTSASVNLADSIILVPVKGGSSAGRTAGKVSAAANVASIVVETKSAADLYGRVKQSGTTIITPINELRGRQFFRCLDLDRNVVEVIDQQPGSPIGKTSSAGEMPDDEISDDLFREGDPPDGQ